jgi:hypothetical protein
VPDCLDWDLEYILLHERNRATRSEIEEHWSLEDMAKARLALDLTDELNARARRKAEQQAQMRELSNSMNKPRRRR